MKSIKKIIVYAVLTLIFTLIGLLFGWLVGSIMLFTLCGATAGFVGSIAWDHWYRIFNNDLSFWWCGLLMILICAMIAGNIGAITGCYFLSVGLGSFFGLIIVSVSTLMTFCRRSAQG